MVMMEIGINLEFVFVICYIDIWNIVVLGNNLKRVVLLVEWEKCNVYFIFGMKYFV